MNTVWYFLAYLTCNYSVYRTNCQEMNLSEIKRTPLWVLVIPLVLYVNTLFNGYVLDDAGLLIDNSMTEQGLNSVANIFTSGYRATLQTTDTEFYRPLPKLFFAVYWWISPANPIIPHGVNLVLFCLICAVWYHMLLHAFQIKQEAAALSVLLFAVHPIHTEVVANSKSLDELLAAWFMLLSIRQVFGQKRAFNLILSGLFSLLALLSKESAAVILLIIPVCLYTFTTDSPAVIVRKSIPAMLALALALAIRYAVIGVNQVPVSPLLNYISDISNPLLRIWNALYIQSVYIVKLFFPYPLLCDSSATYFQSISFISFSSLLVLVVLAAAVLLFIRNIKTNKTIVFACIWYAVTVLPSSNLLFVTGTHYSERSLFVPSFAFCIILAIYISERFRSEKLITVKGMSFSQRTIYLTIACVLLYSSQTISRNREWSSNESLFGADIQKAPESAMLNAYYASALMQKKVSDSYKQSQNLQLAISHLNQAVQLYPPFDKAYATLGDAYAMNGNKTEAESAYEKSIQLNPNNAQYINNYGNFLFTTGKISEAEQKFKQALTIAPRDARANSNLGSVYGTMARNAMQAGDTLAFTQLLDSALSRYTQAIRYDASFPDAYEYASVIYRYKGDNAKAETLSNQVNKIRQKQRKRMK